MTMPVLSRARSDSSLLTFEGLSNSTPSKPSFLIRLNFSSIETLGFGRIMPYLTAKRSFGFWGARPAQAAPAVSAAALPRNPRRVIVVMSHHLRDSRHRDRRHRQRHRHIEFLGHQIFFGV